MGRKPRMIKRIVMINGHAVEVIVSDKMLEKMEKENGKEN